MSKVLPSLLWAPCCLGCCGEGQEQLLILGLPVVSPLALGIQKTLGLRTQKLFSLLKIPAIFENESIYFSALFFPMFSRNCLKTHGH